MKDYLCLSCGEDFNDPLTIGENNSEAIVCPVCKSDNITIQEQFLKRLHKRHGNDGKDFLKLLIETDEFGIIPELKPLYTPMQIFEYYRRNGQFPPMPARKTDLSNRGPGNYGC